MTSKINLLSNLIKCKSVTPTDQECQNIITKYLVPLNFEINSFQQGNVSNLLAINSISKPVFAFIGHTDVVEAGPLHKWDNDPFIPLIKDGYIYGRGAADMKGNLTAFIFAVKKFLDKHPKHRGSISILLTSGEEGNECHNGLPEIIKNLPFNEIDYCLVGEPTSESHLGDTIKVGRRGSLSINLEIKGQGGHIAYPEYCNNPIDIIPNIIKHILLIDWDDQDNIFDKTNLEFTNIYTLNNSGNMIPDSIFLDFNLRFNPNTPIEKIKNLINNTIKEHSTDFTIKWTIFGKPYLSKQNKLFSITSKVIKDITKLTPKSSTTGGTSDGRYIANICKNIIEFGCLNTTIHKPNEKINISDLDTLTLIYYRILEETLL